MKKRLTAVLAIAVMAGSSLAQEKQAKQIQLASLPAESVTPDHLNALGWRNIGPDVGSRVSAVAGPPTKPAVFYSGNAYSGVWESTDGGQYW
ncbi:MAG: hypothetical protein DRP64_18410, partial [Verrucomicrobia bacterium]